MFGITKPLDTELYLENTCLHQFRRDSGRG